MYVCADMRTTIFIDLKRFLNAFSNKENWFLEKTLFRLNDSIFFHEVLQMMWNFRPTVPYLKRLSTFLTVHLPDTFLCRLIFVVDFRVTLATKDTKITTNTSMFRKVVYICNDFISRSVVHRFVGKRLNLNKYCTVIDGNEYSNFTDKPIGTAI